MKRLKRFFRRLFNRRHTVESGTQITSYRPARPKKNDFVGPSSKEHEIEFPKKLAGGATPAPVPADPVFSCIEFLATKLLTGVGAAAWNSFYTDVINQGVTEMTQILESLETIEKTLNELVKLYKNTTYEEYINQRYKFVSEMINAQAYYNQQLEKLDPDSDKAKSVLMKWSESLVGGNSALVQFENFIDWLLGVKINQNTLYNIYDLYVYNTTPWEHMGYEFRENLRELDCAAIASNAALTMLYIKQNPDIDEDVRENQLNTVSKKLQQYYDYYEEHKVVRREDKYICQIEHTHFEMDRTFWTKNFLGHPWFPNGTDWDEEHAESSWCLLWGSEDGTIAGTNCGKQLYKEELNRIRNYYGGEKTYWDIFFDVLGFKLPEGFTDAATIIPLCTWVVDHPEDSYRRAQFFGETVRMSRNSIDREQVGTAYVDHVGFLWLGRRFTGWSWFRTNANWAFTNVTWRDEDNWKEYK